MPRTSSTPGPFAARAIVPPARATLPRITSLLPSRLPLRVLSASAVKTRAKARRSAPKRAEPNTRNPRGTLQSRIPRTNRGTHTTPHPFTPSPREPTPAPPNAGSTPPNRPIKNRREPLRSVPAREFPALMPHDHTSTSSSAPTGSVIVVGTVATATSVMSQLRSLGSATPRVVGVILVNPGDSANAGMIGAPILGEVEDLPDVCAQLGVRTAIVSLPAALSKALSRVRETLRAAEVAERFFPPITDMLADTAIFSRGGSPRLDLAHLVGREPKKLDETRVRAMLAGKRALITGAGGSIGSELARRCAALGVSELILLERSENALFDIDRQIGALFPALKKKVVLHDVVEADATLRRFVALRPQVVFHAAAHKHVPMMEDHPAAAVNNNLFGTKSVADASRAVGVERFVMISTDKAVNPTSVMGATKRLAEIYVRSLNDSGRATRCCLVRFGNVLGSACSVLPIWGAQIAEGGPVTVTHPEMTRFFMTIPEAASLVIQAATVDDDGADVLVLDMGEPVLIKGLAERFIKAHGLVPTWNDPTGGADSVNAIRVLFTGTRPGEKLHEELSYSAEELQATPVPGVLAWSGQRPGTDTIMQMIAEMSGVRHAETPSVVLEAIKRQLAALDGAGANRLVSAEAA